MGRYEDLLEQAREGDADAFDALEKEFNVSTLREKAEKSDAHEAAYKKALPMLRKARLEELTEKLSDDLKEVVLDVGDLGEFDPDDLTLETVQEKAQAKLESTQAARLAVAEEAGFDSVEEYQEALETVKQQKAEQRTGMEDVGAGAASAGGEPPGEEEPTLRETAQSAWDESKKSGESEDISLARSIDAILEAQATAEE